MNPNTKVTPVKAAAKADTCRWGEGRYHSPATAKACRAPKAAHRQLCDPHEKAMRAAIKAARPVAPKPTTPKPTRQPAKAHGAPVAKAQPKRAMQPPVAAIPDAEKALLAAARAATARAKAHPMAGMNTQPGAALRQLEVPTTDH